MSKVIVTGASGFIGSYLLNHLEGVHVQAMSLRDPDWKDNLSGVDAIIHCAGIAHSQKSLPEEDYFRVNCEYTKKLLDLALNYQVSQFIYLSTMLVYGEGHLGKITRESQLSAKNAYAKSKVCAEQVLLGVQDKINVTILRLPLVYGDQVKGNLHQLKRLAAISPIFLRLNNKRSVIRLDDLTTIINEILINPQPGIYHPVSETVSTSTMYQWFRGQKTTWYLHVPAWIRRLIITKTKRGGKIIGDAYYSEELINRERNQR
jgi:UDP-glucose 4-epimerase